MLRFSCAGTPVVVCRVCPQKPKGFVIGSRATAARLKLMWSIARVLCEVVTYSHIGLKAIGYYRLYRLD